MTERRCDAQWPRNGIRRLSITARLTVLFAMTSASVLVGLGLLIAQALKTHFASEDYVTLGERMELVTRIAAQADADSLAQRVDAALRNHPGFIARIELPSIPVLILGLPWQRSGCWCTDGGRPCWWWG